MVEIYYSATSVQAEEYKAVKSILEGRFRSYKLIALQRLHENNSDRMHQLFKFTSIFTR